MAERNEVYKCEACGNIIEVLDGGAGELVCCGEAMDLLDEQTADAAKEKHVPVAEECDGRAKVKVGTVPHPMDEDHYIEWIEVMADDKKTRQYLKPGDAPEAMFCTGGALRSYCNKHGLWKG
ncbi:MAG: desulfoferrodoxin [Planctomycetes bacterium]|nr:desulfoferrodoxin [Planctomycetota bacterium]